MSFFGNISRILFASRSSKSGPGTKKASASRRGTSNPGRARYRSRKVQLLQSPSGRSSIPYWRLRKWRRVKKNLYLGYFKTRLGRCHGVIKWNSRLDHNVYIHNLPQAILKGPHRSCFIRVKPNKYKVHFSQLPADLNSAIFYMETLLQEAFENG